MITPFHERAVFRGRSYGLSSSSYDFRVAQEVVLRPGDFRLASTMERVRMPTDLQGTVRDKSSWAREGIAVQNTLIDPGFCGYITLELTNHGTRRWTIPAGTPIMQMAFELLDEPTELPYNGKYQNQEPGPQKARLERDEPDPNDHPFPTYDPTTQPFDEPNRHEED